MKIAIASDLHLEMGSLELYNTEKADVLILAGDIILAYNLFEKNEKHYLLDREFIIKKSDQYHNFFQQVCEEFKDVIYIFGNHESYNFDIAETYSHIKEKLSYLKNLHVLEKESININDITFICGTMWTNFDNNNPIAMRDISVRMNDFIIIKNSNGKTDPYLTSIWSPEDAYQDHLKFIDFAKKELDNEDNKKVVMVTHHCPSQICIPDKYKGDTKMNHGYISNLEEFILDHPKIRIWVCGHSHRILDDMVGPTNVVMNCRGYPGEEDLANNFKLKFLNI